MANRYSQNFTLLDIFNNRNLRNKIPLINYKEKTLPTGKVSRTTSGKTVSALVYDVAKKGARPYYKPLISRKSGDEINLSGTLVGDYNDAISAVYEAIKASKQMITFTANNADMIRNALKEAEKNKRRGGHDSVLYLRVQSMLQIESMNARQLNALINNIMENIMFSDDFIETQNKYRVSTWQFKGGKSYDEMKQAWERRVGIQ